jgi:hypothetical protein
LRNTHERGCLSSSEALWLLTTDIPSWDMRPTLWQHLYG